MEQGTLVEFGGSESGDSDRPRAEAAAVAGSDGDEDAQVVELSEEAFPDAEGHIEFAVTQVNYTVEGRGDDEHAVLHVFGRVPEAGGDDRVTHARVHNFRPYFYTLVSDLDLAADAAEPLTQADVVDSRLDHDRLTGIETYGDRAADGIDTGDHDDRELVVYESIRGESLVKVFGQTPRDVGELRDRFDHYEADILFPNRLLIDKDITSGVRVPVRRLDDGSLKIHHTEIEPVDVEAESRVHTLDIEVDDRHGFPEDGEQTIICLTAHDSYRDEYMVWLFEDESEGVTAPDEISSYEPIGDDDPDIEVHRFGNEAEMLVDYLEYVDRTDPDLLTGWNFTDFDAPYLINRIDRLAHEHDRLDSDRLSRVNEVWDSGWGGPNIKGRVVFDLLYAYQRTQFSELDSYRLDAVGEEELGVGKERYPGDIGDLWSDDPERLLEYNLRDVELCVELDRKQEIIPFWEEVATFVGCKLEDATTPGDAVDMYVLHEIHGEFALPSKGRQESEEYEGGAVFDPISGVKEMVSVLDLKSLYPMCMVTINASPETKVDPDTYDDETYVAPNGTHFRKEPDGMIREMVDELLEEREQKKALRNENDPGTDTYETYDRQQAAVKVIMNCFTPDTDVLTPHGIRGIRELSTGDEVYSLDPETMEMEIKPVVETHEYPDYRGELVDIETSKIDFSVTPNHRMLVRKNESNGITEKEWDFVEAGELDQATNYELPHDWEGPDGDDLREVDLTELIEGDYEVWVCPEVHGHTFISELGWKPRRVQKDDTDQVGYVFGADEFETHRRYIESVCERSYIRAESGRRWIPRTCDGDDFLELLAWYITEGSVYTSNKKTFDTKGRGSSATREIAQSAVAADGGDNRASIGALLNRMGFDHYTDARCHQFTSAVLGDLFGELVGNGSENRQIPELVFEASQRQKELFLETLIAGDGDRQPNSWRYSTASERLRDGVLRLCAHLGLTASYNENNGTYRIHATENVKNTLRMNRNSERTTADDGVYCVTVEDNHTLMAGRNGTFQFVGQSLYGVLGWDRFRLYDEEMGAAVTATGRDVIEFTERAASEIDKEVTYGDTDSIMLELGGDISKDEAIEQSFEIESHINDAYDEFAERLNATSHRFEIEFEKLYRRFFQAGKKKRYAGHIIWSEGKNVDDIDITGFEYKRSDIAPITKEVQKKVLEMIVTGADREEIKSYVGEVIERVQAGEVSLDEIGIPGGIGKKLDNYETDTAQVRGAKYANLLFGTNFSSGSKPKRVYLEKVHPSFFRKVEAEKGLDPSVDQLYGEFKREAESGDAVICFEFDDQVPDAFEVDDEKMLDKTLKGPIARILEALDISWDEVESGQEQTGLGSFM
ncbi:DNA polymerase domain-containing protein [Natronomonas sp.]|jgi:DNA polymerase I|uniref:DNA polymerase domain-containing protein n=1 Tax=Natronomonas sp. TaxID=2184060 RepID=UPI003989066E